MEKKSLCIRIGTTQSFSPVNLRLRHTLEDSITERRLGYVWDSGIGQDYMEVNVECVPTAELQQAIESLLKSLGLLENSSFTVSEMPDDDDDD